jgi:hypothetical protein
MTEIEHCNGILRRIIATGQINNIGLAEKAINDLIATTPLGRIQPDLVSVRAMLAAHSLNADRSAQRFATVVIEYIDMKLRGFAEQD